MSAVVLSDQKMVAILIRLKNLKLAPGVATEFRSLQSGDDHKIIFTMVASPDIKLVWEVTEPPSEENMDCLYLESVKLAEAARNEKGKRQFLKQFPPVGNIGGIPISLKGLGFDQ